MVEVCSALTLQLNRRTRKEKGGHRSEREREREREDDFANEYVSICVIFICMYIECSIQPIIT